MVTIYNLLEVDEKASKEEIEKAYQSLILEYHQDPKLTPKENEENELILNKVKIAYEILMNDEKRAKYDKDLAKKRAEELIKNVSLNNENKPKEDIEVKQEINNSEDNKYNDEEYDDDIDNNLEYEVQEQNYQDDDVTLSKEEQRKVKKAAQDEFKNNLKKAQKAEEEYNKAYNEAYNNYMKKMGYKVKEPLTLQRIKNVAIFIIAVIIVCALAWIIPPIRNILIDLYNENFIIKSLVDIVRLIFNAIIGIFK